MMFVNILQKISSGIVNGGRSALLNGRLLHSTSKTLNNESEFDNYSSEDEDTESMDSTVDDAKQSILKAALTHVHQHNWSRMALAKGADSVGLAAAAHGLFSRGEVELVEYFNQTCNQELVNSLEKNPPQTQRERSEEQMNVIRSTLEQRLRMILPYIDSWPKALTLMSHPPNVLHSAKSLFEMVDDVLYYAGDRSADFSWYPKRAGLAAVYVATELALLNDKSTDYADTWSFLDRRLQDYNCGGTIYKKAETAVENLPEFVGGTIATLRNMLGIGSIGR